MSARLAVIGNPIAHSRSPALHQRFGELTGIALSYEKLLGEMETVEAQVAAFFAQGGLGMNVTLPFKERLYHACTHLSTYAQAAKAVNTLWLDDAGQLCGDNTDGRGLCEALLHAHGLHLKDKRVLLIGAGGAAKGVALPLCEQGIAHLSIANRSFEKAQALCTTLSAYACQALPLSALSSSEQTFDIVINATDTGLSNTPLPLDASLIHAQTFAYEMVYGKPTPFLEWAKAHQLAYADGYSMLIGQARLSFAQWFGVMPPVEHTAFTLTDSNQPE